MAWLRAAAAALRRWAVVSATAVISFSGVWAVCQLLLTLDRDASTAIAGMVMALVTSPLAAWAASNKPDHKTNEDNHPVPIPPAPIGFSRPPLDDPPGDEIITLRGQYLQLVRQRYRRIDMEVLTPLSEQDDHPPVLLADVFIGQQVKADPPPVELPRELVLRLVNGGVPEARQLPEGMDRAMLERVRQAYDQRPSAPVLSLLSTEGDRVVMLGDPGAGKSTLARYVAYTLAGVEVTGPLEPLAGWLPILIELREFAQYDNGTLLDYLDHLHANEGLGLPKEVLEEYLREDGRAVVVFDGLDEIFDPVRREKAAKHIAWFANRYPRVRIMVTSRPFDYQKAILESAGFARHKLQDFDGDQISSFVDSWYRLALPKEPAEAAKLGARLRAAIDTSAAVRELAGNPMLLTILTIIGRRRQLPRDRTTVYEHAVTVLVEQWDPSKFLTDQHPNAGLHYLDAADKLELLRLIARRMQNSPAGLSGNFISGPDLISEFIGFLRQRDPGNITFDQARLAAQTMLKQLRVRDFILSRFGGEVYGFVHRSFLEYLAAADIVQRFNRERTLSEAELINDLFGRRWRDPAWHEVLMLTAGMLDERFVAKAVMRLLKADPHWAASDRVEPQHVFVAIRCIAEVRKIGMVADACRAVVDELVRVLTVAHRRVTRTYNDALNRAIEQSVLPIFEAFTPNWPGRDRYLAWYTGSGLDDTDDSATSAVATRLALTLLGDDWKLFDFLRTQALHGRSASHRQAAVWAIAAGWRSHPEGLPLVRERAVEDPNWTVRHTAMQAIAAHRADDPLTLPLLRELATTDEHEDVRRSAVQLIADGWPQDMETLPLLHRLVETDRDEHIRSTAVRALAAGWRDDPQTLQMLRRRAITDPHESVRLAGMRAVAEGRSYDAETLVLLRACAGTDSSVDVRRVALTAVARGWPEHSDVLPWLRTQAEADPQAGIRQTALQAIAAGWPQDPDTLPLLLKSAANDPNADVREAATEAIDASRIDAEAIEQLRTLAMTDPNAGVRRSAVQAIVDHRRNDPDVLAWLRSRATDDPHEQVRRSAVQMVVEAWRDKHEALAWLRERAESDDAPAVRRAALRAVADGWHDDRETRQWIQGQAATDPAEDVRQAGVQAIAEGWTGHEESMPWLCDRAMIDPNEQVRHSAVQALAARWHHDPETHRFFHERAETDPHEFVRRALVWAVADGWRDNSRTLPFLHERLTDRHPYVRRAAAQAIAAGWREDSGTRPMLHQRATGDPNEYVRHAALQAIIAGWRQDPQALQLVRDRAERDQHPAVRLAALQALAECWPTDRDTLSLLDDRAGNDLDEDVRQTADALRHGKFGD